ncbi:MAG: GMC family oxidoreductase [Bryobacterales bacterium]|nr:GMC family oxidoreductase [Bryobacterales bacterium]
MGRYLCEQVRINVHGFAPQLYGAPASNDDGISGGHVYFPRNDDPAVERDYMRGFGIELWDIGCQANASYAKRMAGFGAGFKRAVRERYPARIELHPFGEVLPRASNRITVDPTRTDRYGVPIARIDYDIGDSERRMVDAMYDKVEEILRAMRAEVLPYKRGETDAFGSAIHEHGTCRMGEDPARSMLDPFNRMHEVPNVLVVDGSAFPTASEKNPTLTILALSWRATDRLAESMRLGEA